MVKHPGITLTLGGTKYVVPPLTLGALQQLQPRLAAFQGGVDASSIDTVLDVALAALRRNYPEITREEIAEAIDVANMADVFAAVMGISGLTRRSAEAGEA